MSKDDDQIEIEVDAAPDVVDDVKVETAVDRKVVNTDDALQALKSQLSQEKSARADAERRAQEAANYAYTAQGEARDSNLNLLTNALATIEQTNEILKANYRDAMSVGDFDRAADIQSDMSLNAARRLQLEQGKQAMESEPTPQAPQPYNPYQNDPVEALASQLSGPSARWVRSHPEYATDQRLYQKMLAAHNLAMADGIPVDSDDYFAEIESTLKIGQSASRAYDDPTDTAAKVTQRRSAPPAAPVSRSGSAPGDRPNVVRLTPQQVEMAEMMGMTKEEYAKNLRALQKEGKMN